MVTAKIHLYIGGSVSKSYIFEGFLNDDENKTQNSIDTPFPGKGDDEAVINSIFGQKRIFTLTFIIMDRDDDYTDETGSPTTYSSEEQRTWLMDTIFVPNGYHVLRDTNGNLFSGRIEGIRIVNAGDDPVKLDCIMMFKRGIVPTASNLTPI